jgi:hypothetical protein
MRPRRGLQYPYHINALLTVSEYCKHAGDVAMAGDFVGPSAPPHHLVCARHVVTGDRGAAERALFSAETAFHPLFSVATGLSRLHYTQRENRCKPAPPRTRAREKGHPV